jgi:hypothetical protein
MGGAGASGGSAGEALKTVDPAAVEGFVNKLTTAYPSGLALTAFPKSNSKAALALAEDEVAEDKSLKEKHKEAEKIMSGKGESCVAPILMKQKKIGDTVTCYEFDQDLIYSESQAGGQKKTMGTLDGKDSKGEACLVSFARSKIQDVVDNVDRATGMVQTMLCQARKSGTATDLPEVGATIDLKAAMGAIMKGGGAPSMEIATIQRLDDVEGRAVYRTDIVMKEPMGVKRTVHLVHSPGAEGDAAVFNGTLWTSFEGQDNSKGQGSPSTGPNSGASGAGAPPTGSGPAGGPGTGVPSAGGPAGGPAPGGGLGLQQDTSTKIHSLSIVYSGSKDADGKPRVKYELRHAKINEQLFANAFSAEGVLDLNVGADSSGNYVIAGKPVSQANEAVDGVLFIGFDVNPDTNEGTLSYWQNPGGNYSESARGMIFNIEAADDGTLQGCGTTGAAYQEGAGSMQGMSVRMALKENKTLKPSGFYHPFLNTENGQSGTATSGTDSLGTYFERTQQGGAATKSKWYLPDAGNTSLSNEFVTKQHGGIITRQCFKQDAAGSYAIDTTIISAPTGYELIQATDPAKMIKPPALEKMAPVGFKPRR